MQSEEFKNLAKQLKDNLSRLQESDPRYIVPFLDSKTFADDQSELLHEAGL